LHDAAVRIDGCRQGQIATRGPVARQLELKGIVELPALRADAHGDQLAVGVDRLERTQVAERTEALERGGDAGAVSVPGTYYPAHDGPLARDEPHVVVVVLHPLRHFNISCFDIVDRDPGGVARQP